MTTRIATFNVENLFNRPKVFNEEVETDRKGVIENVAKLSSIIEQDHYSDSDKNEIIALAEKLNLNKYNEGPMAFIRTIRGQLIRRPKNSPPEVVADCRSDWIGWVALKTAPVNEIAIENTGRVIRDVDADILAVIEAENRELLAQFSSSIVERVSQEISSGQRPVPYEHVMLIDGNDRRGIDVGLLTKPGFPIAEMRSHIDDKLSDGKLIFSRDCPEYAVTTPDGDRIWILPNHFKSKHGGNDERSQAKRKAQAARTAEIYKRLINCGESNIAVVGDLNDEPFSDPLRPLLAETDLKDVTDHPRFEVGEFNAGPNNDHRGIGTFKLGNDNDKLDYLLLSPDLFVRVKKAGFWRKGAWPGSRPPRWEVYSQLKRKIHVASDHHVLWVDID